MEKDGSFAGSVALDWIMQELAKTPPIPIVSNADSCPPLRLLGAESDAGLRMRALRRKLARPAKREEEGLLTDPRMREGACQVLDKLLFLDRKMTLGSNAVGISRFKVYPDGKIGEYAKSK